MPLSPSSSLRRYLIAVGAVAVATATRVALAPVLQTRFPLLAFLVAIVLTAWYGGFGPAVLAVCLSWLSIDRFIVAPRGPVPLSGARWQSIFAFFVVGMAIALLGEALRAARRRAQASDMKARHVLEEQQADRERFARFMQHLPGLAWIKDAEGRYVYANDAAERAFQRSRAELYGKTDVEVFPPETARQFHENDQRVFTAGSGVQVIETLLHDDGVLHHSLVSKFPIPGPDRRPALVGGMAIDITDRMEMESALREQAERLRLALDSGRMGTWEWDIRTNKVTWSDNLEQIHGLPRGGFEGTFAGFQRLVHPEDQERVERAINDSLEHGTVYEVEFRNLRPDGSVHWISGRGMVFADDTGQPIRMIGTAMDITERKLIETTLREADRRKEEFLAVLSHELRNPLAPIRTSLSLMGQAGLSGAEFERERAVVERQVQHLTRLVDDLLDVSRINRGGIELQKEVVGLSETIADVVEAVKVPIAERRQQLDITLPEAPIRLEADPTRLEQILLNLLTNASKYTDVGGRIGLTATLEGDEVVVSVHDTGIGISAEILPRVFDLFVQGERRLDQALGGMGIGLSLVKNLVEKHGGSVAAHSDGPGLGSEFVVRLPALARARAAALDSKQPARPVDSQAIPRRRILVVDDNAAAADSLGRLLNLVFGQEVEVAYDGTAALDLAGTFRPEMVLLDLGMAAMDGYEVAMRLRERPECARLRIIAVTGWGQQEDRRRTLEAGFDVHLVKPVDVDSLRKLLASPPGDGQGSSLLSAVSEASTS
jgi:two-component system CheB/CheR fusion protein